MLNNKKIYIGAPDSIREYIRKMSEYSYLLPNELVNLAKDKNNLTSLEFDIGYEGYLDSVVESIRGVLKSLRDEKIAFWKKIFDTYKDDKEAYDLEFRTKSLRHKKDLDKFSKVNIDEHLKNT